MEHRVLLLDDYLTLIWRHKGAILFSLITMVGISAAIYFATPKEYKSSTTLAVQSAFFNAPLASELIPSITDPSEINSERNAILEKALDEPFIDDLAQGFGIYTTEPGTGARGTERALFRAKIESFRTGSSFQLSISSEDPQKAFKMMTRISEHILDIISKYRSQQLRTAERVIEERVDFLSAVLANAGDEKAKARVKSKLEEVNARIASLKSRFTEEHPQLIVARTTEKELSLALKQMQPQNEIIVPEGMTIDTVHPGGTTNQALYAELVNLLSKLKIMVSMEGNQKNPAYVSIVSPPQVPLIPFKPQKERYIGLGLLSGIIFAALLVLYFERKAIPLESLDDDELALIFDAPILGELPLLVTLQKKIRGRKARLPEPKQA
jgi:capsular polysaccharide biosynthesis protein